MAFGGGSRERGADTPFRILDLGSGPAPCSIAAAEWFGAKQVSIVACDRSAGALESGRRLAESAGYAFTGVDGWDATVTPPPDGPFDLIIAGHVLNELWKGQVDRIDLRRDFMARLMHRLDPAGALLVLEPATLAASRDMLALRDLLAASGISILAPCLRSGSCPALALEGQSCHSDFLWKPNATVRELSRRTGLDKDLVKTAGFVFAPNGRKNGSPDAFRVVSEPMLNKAGRLRLLICGEEGRFPLSAKIGEGFPAESAFRALRRSDSLELSGAVKRESGLGLGGETKIVRVSPEVS
jgi:SAM-dependent methyltransferase